MEPILYETIHRLEATNWWFRGMRSIAQTLLAPLPRAKRAVDIGCGTGGNLELLRGFADEVIALDLSPHALGYARDVSGAGTLIAADAQRLPLRSGTVDLAWLFNVVEHLPDDGAALGEIARVLRPGGFALVATSASMWLWSDHDVANHHHRRYRRRQLSSALETAGLSVKRLTHANAALFAPTAVVAAAHRARARLWGRPAYEHNVVEVSKALDTPLRWMLEGEARWLKSRDLPFGVSLFALAEKR